MVQAQMYRLLDMYAQRRQTIIVEGVHLDVHFMMEVMRRHPTCLPFLVYISNEVRYAV